MEARNMEKYKSIISRLSPCPTCKKSSTSGPKHQRRLTVFLIISPNTNPSSLCSPVSISRVSSLHRCCLYQLCQGRHFSLNSLVQSILLNSYALIKPVYRGDFKRPLPGSHASHSLLQFISLVQFRGQVNLFAFALLSSAGPNVQEHNLQPHRRFYCLPIFTACLFLGQEELV